METEKCSVFNLTLGDESLDASRLVLVILGAKGAMKEDTVILSWMEAVFLCTAQIFCL